MAHFDMDILPALKRVSRSRGRQPVFFTLSSEKDRKKVSELISKKQIQYISDDFEEQCRELFAIKHPTDVFQKDFESRFKLYYDKQCTRTPQHLQGVWVYYPWLVSLVHILKEKDFYSVRTARNKYLINEKERYKPGIVYPYSL